MGGVMALGALLLGAAAEAEAAMYRNRVIALTWPADTTVLYHQQQTDRKVWDIVPIAPLWLDEEGVIHAKTTRGTDEPAPVSRNP